MKINLSYKEPHSHEAVEKQVARSSGKLGKLLKSYEGDLVQLHGAFEKHPRRVEYSFSLSITLPTGTLHALGKAADVRGSVRRAFADIVRQVKKHQEKLRHDYEWKRKRPRSFASVD
jgi:ribosome-associated translation inhibitor RaiA